MSKERLEEIFNLESIKEKLVDWQTEEIMSTKVDFWPLDIRRVEWLIEQAKRVQEVNKENKRLEIKNLNYFKDIETLTVQNKRYREALEFYANRINYQAFVVKSNIEHDNGKKARKALEGEE